VTEDLSRRDIIKLGAAATVASALSVRESIASQSRSPAFFTAEEFAMVDELSELIVPADEHSPGARAAKVAAYIDARLAEAFEESDKRLWREGLAGIERLFRATTGKPFAQSSAEERLAILTRLAQNERTPNEPDELFFVELKSRVVDAYYTSEIGIKQELEYKGNTYLGEFVGTDVSSDAD
jgi:hypothetical protein